MNNIYKSFLKKDTQVILENPLLEQKKDIIKRRLISSHNYLMIFVLFFYSLYFFLVAENNEMGGYLLFGLCLTVYSWLIIGENYNIGRIVHTYIILGSVFNLFIVAAFWKYSLVSYVWLLPIPFAAFIFFKPKIAIYYTVYIFVNISMGYRLSELISSDVPTFQSRSQLIISDIFVIVFNLAVVILLSYYYDQIRKLELSFSYSAVQEVQEDVELVTEDKEVNNEELVKFNLLFEKIEKAMVCHQYFKDSDLTASKFSLLMNSNTTYILKAIKQNGYINFTSFLNEWRVNYVKRLITENDLKKVTLMYLYTEAGFSNQSTFNRVFKQIEGITPSEYIHHMVQKKKMI